MKEEGEIKDCLVHHVLYECNRYRADGWGAVSGHLLYPTRREELQINRLMRFASRNLGQRCQFGDYETVQLTTRSK
jgi:hypothetical protein